MTNYPSVKGQSCRTDKSGLPVPPRKVSIGQSNGRRQGCATKELQEVYTASCQTLLSRQYFYIPCTQSIIVCVVYMLVSPHLRVGMPKQHTHVSHRSNMVIQLNKNHASHGTKKEHWMWMFPVFRCQIKAFVKMCQKLKHGIKWQKAAGTSVQVGKKHTHYSCTELRSI